MNAIEKESKMVVFDFDETLVHSKKMFTRLNKRAMDMMGFSYTKEIAENLYAMVRNTYIGWGKDLEEQKKIFFTQFSDLVTSLCNKELFLKQMQFYNGMREVIKELAKMDINLAVASSRDVYSIIKFLAKERIISYFNMIEATDGGRRFKDKPDTEILKFISKKLETPLKNAVMIGDTKGDVQMGKNAGMKTIGIGYGEYVSAEKMKSYQPDEIIEFENDIKKIPEIVNSLLNER